MVEAPGTVDGGDEEVRGGVDPAEEPVHEDEDFSEIVAAGEHWVRRRFVRCSFTGSDLRGLRTEACTFDECDFSRADLGDSQHRGTALRTCSFTGG